MSRALSYMQRRTQERMMRRGPVAAEPVAPLEQRQRVRNPVTVAEHPNWYQVMRIVRVGQVLDFECIGEFPNETDANLHAMWEQGRARVTYRGKQLIDNWHPIERREE